MRRTNLLLRGARGRGWYYKQITNPEGFVKYEVPKAFDWNTIFTEGVQRPIVYFDMAAEVADLGRLKFELASDVVPNTVDNFISLLKNSSNKYGYEYKNTIFHRIIKDTAILGGDVEHLEGQGNHSSLNSRYIKDENFIIPHSERGLLSMHTVGRDTSGSQFNISLKALPHLNGRGVVFGRLIEGKEVLEEIETIFTFRGVPSKALVIKDAGII